MYKKLIHGWLLNDMVNLEAESSKWINEPRERKRDGTWKQLLSGSPTLSLV